MKIKKMARRAKWRVLINLAHKRAVWKGRRYRRAYPFNIRYRIQVSLKKLFIGRENHVNFLLFLGLLVQLKIICLPCIGLWLLGVFLQSCTNINPRFLVSVDTFNPNNSAVRWLKKICLLN